MNQDNESSGALRPADDRATAATQSNPQAVSSKAGIPSAADRWAARSAITEAEIDAALRGSVPGGSAVWVWLPQEDAWTPHQTAREVMRSAIFALDQYRTAQGTEARRDETRSGSACDGPVPTGCAQPPSSPPEEPFK